MYYRPYEVNLVCDIITNILAEPYKEFKSALSAFFDIR